jgi:tetratricopeptide (TPR) repeat protein
VTEPSSEDLVSDGWQDFESGNYSRAIGAFEEALDADATTAEAYSGLGWCYIRTDDLEQAQTNFMAALEHDYAGKEIFAGLAAVELARQEYEQAIGYAESLLNIDPDWVFSHDDNIDYQDLWLLVAMAYYHEGELPEVASAVEHIDPMFSITESNALSWKVGDTSYSSFQEALAAYMESISSELIA